ncbi:hypothetical protein IGL98_001726 [Enterococcus sp. DIV0840]|uniref:hypothetical protein n=1 Tax=Enterococcus TaxID=1350 RepID=UPI001A8ED78D|nr:MULTISPECIES: hypothetical protein [Enterococcus]MBO0435062.1 hypothetical protein [Enterococcus sp. DIV0849a]MBO0472659.1 hypothetical protein [Enterococcus ureasiticus]
MALLSEIASFVGEVGFILLIFSFRKDFHTLTILQKTAFIFLSFSAIIPFCFGLVDGFLSSI